MHGDAKQKTNLGKRQFSILVMMKKGKIRKEDLQKPVTLGVLFEFTEEILLPRIEEIVKKVSGLEKRMDGLEGKMEGLEEKMGTMEYNLKAYIDKKFDEYITDLFNRLNRKEQKEKQFKEKVVDLLKRHGIGTVEELAFLEGLAKGA